MSTPTPNEIRFARLSAITDADPDVAVDASLRDAATVDAGGDSARHARSAEQARLREACGRVMDSPEHRCPEGLRTQITAGIATDDAPAQTLPPVVAGRIGPGRWVGAVAAAALIAISTVAVVGTLKTLRPGPQSVGNASVAQVLNTSQAAAFDSRHGVCGANPTTLVGSESFPKTVDGLADVIDAGLDSAKLDLSDIGFRYRAAGHCVVPGPGAVHVVYGNDAGQALSLWLRPHDGKLDLKAGQVYGPPADGPQAGRIRVWRNGDMVFYLVGDLPEDVEQAQPQLALNPV